MRLATHQYADTAGGVRVTSKTCPAGSAQIIWKESGTGSKWAVVRLGATPPQKIADATGIQLQAEGCYNTTDDDIRYPGGQDIDWRGCLLRVTIAYLDDDEADADDSDAWNTVTITPFRCGIDANGGNVGGRGNSISIHTLNAGGGTVCLLLDGVSGCAVVMSVGIRDPEHLQYHVRIDAGGQYDENTNDDMDGGV